MLASNLDLMVDVVCSLPDQFTRSQFDKMLVSKGGKDYCPSTRASYFYFPKKMGLFVTEKRIFLKSHTCKKLCDLYAEKDYTSLTAYLADLIESGEPVFRDFLAFMNTPRTRQEIERKYNPYTRKILIQWAKKFCLIRYGDRMKQYYRVQVPSKPPSGHRFWKTLVEWYERLRRTELVGVKGAYVKIPVLREACSVALGLKGDSARANEFDDYLGMILTNREYSKRIELSGAPLAYVEEEGGEPFLYLGRKYYFIALR